MIALGWRAMLEPPARGGRAAAHGSGWAWSGGTYREGGGAAGGSYLGGGACAGADGPAAAAAAAAATGAPAWGSPTAGDWYTAVAASRLVPTSVAGWAGSRVSATEHHSRAPSSGCPSR